MPKLRVFSQGGNFTDYELPRESGQIFLIGSAEDVNLRFELKSFYTPLSAYHAYIRNQDGKYLIYDGSPDKVPSEKGTFLNGEKITTRPYLLNPGDNIMLGKNTLLTVVDELEQNINYDEMLFSYADERYNQHGPVINNHQYYAASFSSRLIAYLIDMFLINIATYLIVSMNIIFGEFFFIILYPTYFLLVHNGQTPGKMIMNIRVIKGDGSHLDILDALLRNVVGYILSAIFLMFGFIWASLDEKHQAWHDKLANTYVVEG